MYFHVVVIFEYFIYGTLCAYKLYKLLQLKNAKDVFSGMASKYVFYFAIDQGWRIRCKAAPYSGGSQHLIPD